MRRRLMLVSILIAANAPAQAENWPQWRGPLGISVSSEQDLPESWTEDAGVAWKASLRGQGVSTPVVWGEHIFVTSQIGAGVHREGNHPTLVQGGTAREAGERALPPSAAAQKTIVFLIEAFARTDGQPRWTFELPAEGELPSVHEKHNLASASPVTDGERVYAVFGTGQMVAVDMSGKQVWHRNLAAEYGAFQISWGHGSSPVIYKDLVILPCYHEPASYLVALDRRTGATKWRVERDSEVLSYSTPLLVETGSGDELVLNSSQAVEAYAPATGDALWSLDEPHRFAIPTPVQHDGVVYTSRGYRSGPYAAIRTGGRGEISESHVLWKVPTGAPYISSLVYYEGLLYMAGDVGVVTCIDAKTGERVWQERIDGIFTASPVAGDGKIYLLSETGETIVMRAGRTPEVLSRNRIDGRLLASPAISDGQLFLRTDDRLVAVSGAG